MSNKKKNLTREEKIMMRRRKRAKRNIILIILFIILIIAFLGSPIFVIKNIEISGENKVNSSNLISKLNLINNENIILVSKKEVLEKADNPYILDIKLKKKLPSTLEIEIKEKSEDYIAEKDGKDFYITKDGEILGEAKNSDTYKIVVKGINSDLENEKFLSKDEENEIQNFENIKQYFSEINLLDKIDNIDISKKDDMIISVKSENKIIHIGDTNNMEEKILYIDSILKDTKDLSGEIFVNMDLKSKNPYFRENV